MSRKFSIRPASELSRRPLSWLWPYRFPLGNLAILDGDPGLGKSLLALDLCARLSTGREFPDGTPSGDPANCVFLNGEDSGEKIVRPRLEALGADLDRVHILDRSEHGLDDGLQLPDDCAYLDETLARTRARLLVIDPIMEFLNPRVITGLDSSVRKALAPLGRLADKHDCTILLLRHLNKGGGHSSMYRGSGSIRFIGASRSGWLVARDPDEPSICVLAQQKNNLAAAQPSLAYRIEVSSGAEPTVSWLGQCSLTAKQLLTPGRERQRRVRPRIRACELLQSLLQEGPRSTRDIWDCMEEEGLTQATVFRAKQELQIRNRKIMEDGVQKFYWLLPGQELPAPAQAEKPPPDLEEWLEPLRKAYPPPTPLDEPSNDQ